MKRYKLLKDLPLFDAGEDGFYLDPDGNMRHNDGCRGRTVISAIDLARFPHILVRWFEEIPEKLRTVWDLEEGDEYWFIDAINVIDRDIWNGGIFCIQNRRVGNVFLTKDEAKKELARRKAKQVLLRDTKGFKHFKDGIHCGWGVGFDGVDAGARLFAFYSSDYFDRSDLWFSTKSDAEVSIKTHEKEWKIYLRVEE